MNELPFRPRTLTLAIATIIYTSLPVSQAKAESPLSPDEQWNCTVATDAVGWHCAIQSTTSGIRRSTPGLASHTATASPDTSLKTQLDWVPISQLTPKQLNELKAKTPWCQGCYIEPTRPGIDFKGSPKTAPIFAEADESSYDEVSVATLKGNITLRQGHRQLQADTARLDRTNNHAEFKGNVVFREPGIVVVGDSGESYLDTGKATVHNATYALHKSHLRGSSRKVVRNEDTTLELHDATYTGSSPGDNGWLLSSNKVILDPATGFGSARNAVIRVEGLPILYTPYIYFPIDNRRQSGFLYPSFSSSSDNGFELTTPYYWNIAPNYDATITPRYMIKRGLLLENEFRYLGHSYEGELGVASLVGKDQQEDDNRYYDTSRWLVNIRHKQTLAPSWTAEVDYADASDKGYLSDMRSSLNLSTPGPLNQHVGTHYYGGSDNNHWQLSLDAHQYKNMSETSDDPYNKLPQIVLDGQWSPSDRLNVSYLADYTHFSRDHDWHYVREMNHPDLVDPDIKKSVYDEGYGIKKAEGVRAYFESGISMPFKKFWMFLTPEVKLISLNYDLNNLNEQDVLDDLNASYGNRHIDQNGFDESANMATATFSLDSGLFMDRMTHLFNSHYTHTFEPRAKFLYIPYVEDQEFNPVFDTAHSDFSYSSLWHDNRFSGYDRIGDTSQLTLGFTTRLIEKDGFERTFLGLGQIVYFKGREVYIASGLGEPGVDRNTGENHKALDERKKNELTNSTSPLASELVYNINRTMSLRQDVAWNTNENRLDNYGLNYRWKPEQRKTLNIDFRFRDQVDRYVKDSNHRNVLVDPSDPTKGFQMTDDNVKLSDVSFAWPITAKHSWGIMGRWQHDFTNNQDVEQLLGFEHNNCGYRVRLLWRSWIKPDDNIDHPDKKNGIFLQFVLHGLGSITGNSGLKYVQGIQGYETDEK